jgi:hypothetical protein
MASPLNPTKNVEGFIKHDIMGLFDDFREQKMDIKNQLWNNYPSS